MRTIARLGWTLGLLALCVQFVWAANSKGLKSPNLVYLSIDEYVRIVLKQSDQALTAFNNFENSTLSYGVSFRQLLFPTLSVESDVSKTKSDVDSEITKGETTSGSANLSQPLFLSGGRLAATYSESSSRTEISTTTILHSYTSPAYSVTYTQPLFIFVGNSDLRSYKSARLSFDIAADNYKRDMQALENEARAAYYAVLLKSAQLEVERTKLESSRRGNDVTNALVDAGRLAPIELARSEVRLQKDVRRLKSAETELQKTINDALDLATLKIESKVEFTSKLKYTPLTLELDLLIDAAFLHRPDYLAAKRQLELSEISVQEALEANNLTLNAVGSVSGTQTGDGEGPDSNSKEWSGGLNLSWPLFDSGITNMQSQIAKNNLENEKVSFKGLERNIRTEVTNAFLEVKGNEVQLEDFKSTREQAKHSVAAVRTRYQNGRDRLLDVFDSEQELRDLELEYLNTLISANLSKDRLALLVGAPLEEIAKK